MQDFGGCRWQAYLLTGDPDNTDPVCDLSPHHQLVTDMVVKPAPPNVAPPVVEHPLIFRDRKNSRVLAGLDV